ncbi:MAG: hypothetical protein PHC68_16105 [Syntrophorhabdaceae bacterium]|nr:hypothetical protein [Syntrophorhabdaceae bacterium]
MENSIQIKSEVRFKEINKYCLEFLLALDNCCQRFGKSYTITSANDGTHGDGSYHYKNLAWDIRLKDVPKSHWYVLLDNLKAALGKYFDVLVENPDSPDKCHIHAECDLQKLGDWFMDHND